MCSTFLTLQIINLVTFLFPTSNVRSRAQFPDNDTYCGDINARSKSRLLHDILAGINKQGQAHYQVNTTKGWLPPSYHPPTWGREDKPASFRLCVCCSVNTVFLHFHFRLQYFQLISFYKAWLWHNYPLSIRSHPVPHCRLRPLLINHWSLDTSPSCRCFNSCDHGWLWSLKGQQGSWERSEGIPEIVSYVQHKQQVYNSYTPKIG